MILCAIFAALTAVLAQIAIPMPGGVPVTLQTFAALLAGIALGSKKGFIAMLVYILLGAVGLPVFAGFSGGIQRLLGPTGGFLLSFPLAAFIAGFSVEISERRRTRRGGVRPPVVFAHQSGVRPPVVSVSQGGGRADPAPTSLASGRRFPGAIIVPAGVVLALVVNYACGAVMFSWATGAGVGKAVTACILPFVLPEVLKAVGAAGVGLAVRNRVSGLRLAEKR